MSCGMNIAKHTWQQQQQRKVAAAAAKANCDQQDRAVPAV
jgi:hypothetical protein